VSLDRSIFRAIRGSTLAAPQSLAGIIGAVDAMERMILTIRELRDGLKRLIADGYIVEISTQRYCDAEGLSLPRTFSGLRKREYDAAVKAYRRRFEEAYQKLHEKPDGDQFVWQKMMVRWATLQGREPTEDDEDGIEKLAGLIDPVIAASGMGEVNGFEHSTESIDLLIFGLPHDDDVDQIYELVAPVFRQAKCPPGSCLIRHYNERQETLESDHVTASPGERE
jgi:hypothetical protein